MTFPLQQIGVKMNDNKRILQFAKEFGIEAFNKISNKEFCKMSRTMNSGEIKLKCICGKCND